MRGGGIGATAEGLICSLWSSICAAPSKAPLEFKALIEAPELAAPLCANAVAGNDKVIKTTAIFSAVFDIESSSGSRECCRMYVGVVRRPVNSVLDSAARAPAHG